MKNAFSLVLAQDPNEPLTVVQIICEKCEREYHFHICDQYLNKVSTVFTCLCGLAYHIESIEGKGVECKANCKIYEMKEGEGDE